MTFQQTATRSSRDTNAIPIFPFGMSLSVFFAITYLACVALRLVVPDVGNHLPWFQFLPGFDWSPAGILLGLAESIAYGWYVALLFGSLLNFFASRES